MAFEWICISAYYYCTDMLTHAQLAFEYALLGLWQVSGRNKITDFDEVVGLDCKYLDNWRFLDDLKILLKTVVVVLQRKGAI